MTNQLYVAMALLASRASAKTFVKHLTYEGAACAGNAKFTQYEEQDVCESTDEETCSFYNSNTSQQEELKFTNIYKKVSCNSTHRNANYYTDSGCTTPVSTSGGCTIDSSSALACQDWYSSGFASFKKECGATRSGGIDVVVKTYKESTCATLSKTETSTAYDGCEAHAVPDCSNYTYDAASASTIASGCQWKGGSNKRTTTTSSHTWEQFESLDCSGNVTKTSTYEDGVCHSKDKVIIDLPDTAVTPAESFAGLRRGISLCLVVFVAATEKAMRAVLN